MQLYATVTQKGQITIPKKIRELAGIEFYDKVKIVFNKKTKVVELEPTYDLLDIAGKIKPRVNKKTDPLKAREFMEKNYSRV